MATINTVEHYNSNFSLNQSLDSTYDGKLIFSGTSEATADNIAEIVHVDQPVTQLGFLSELLKESLDKMTLIP